MLAPALFNAYLKGGSLWPQKRGGINLFLLSQLFEDDLSNVWSSFVLSDFSREQVEHVRSAMQALHDRAGIQIPVSDDGLSKEWSVTKAAVCRSLIFYARREDPRASGQPLDEFMRASYVSEVTSFVANLDTRSARTMRQLALRAREIVISNADLARLVALTFYSPTERKLESERHAHFYQQAVERYGDSLLKIDAALAREEYLALMTGLLRNTLTKDFPTDFVEWLCWGF